MKRIIVTVILLIAFSKSHAQKPWESLKMDSIQFADQYGTVFEFQLQEQCRKRSHNGWKCFFIGAKYGYLNYFYVYLMKKHLDVNTNDETPNVSKFTATGYDNTRSAKIKISGSFNYDKNNRVTSATITGTANDIVNLFLDYWENYKLNYEELKTKREISVMNASDKISFTWTGSQPVIKLSKGVVSFEFDKKQ